MAVPLQFMNQFMILNCCSTLLTPHILLHWKTRAVLTLGAYGGAIGSWKCCELPNYSSSNKALPQPGPSLLLSDAAACCGSDEA